MVICSFFEIFAVLIGLKYNDFLLEYQHHLVGKSPDVKISRLLVIELLCEFNVESFEIPDIKLGVFCDSEDGLRTKVDAYSFGRLVIRIFDPDLCVLHFSAGLNIFILHLDCDLLDCASAHTHYDSVVAQKD